MTGLLKTPGSPGSESGAQSPFWKKRTDEDHVAIKIKVDQGKFAKYSNG
jgi:hypothetical protein